MMVNFVNRFLRNFDQHGAPVNFTYDNKQTYQTAVGGVLTILSRLGILAFFFVIVNNIINKDKTITLSTIGKSPTQDFQSYHVDLTNFDIGFTLAYNDNLPHIEERTNYFKYFDIKVQYVQTNYYTNSNGTTYRVTNQTEIPLTNCSLNRFANLTQEIMNYGIHQQGWFCPQKIDFNLQGQVQSLNQTRLRLMVSICKNTTANQNWCASYSEIQATAIAARINLATLSTYFNENTYDGIPIKRSLSVEPFAITMGMTQTFQRSLRKNTIYTKDSWMSSQVDNKEYIYYQDMAGFSKIATNNNDFLLFTYTCDGQESFITRKVLSLADAAAMAGGFASIILFAAKIIAKFYAQPLFYSSILAKLYQQEVYRYQPEVEWNNFKKNNRQAQIEQVKHLLTNRKSLQISVLKEFLIISFCRCFKRFQNHKNQALYHKGIYQLQQALDIRKVLTTIQKVQTFERIILKDYQRKLLKFSTRHMLRDVKTYKDKDSYEVKSRTESHIQKLIKLKDKPFNKSLLREIFGYHKQQSISPTSKDEKFLKVTIMKEDQTYMMGETKDKFNDNLQQSIKTDFFKTPKKHIDNKQNDLDASDIFNSINSKRQLKQVNNLMSSRRSKDKQQSIRKQK